MVDFGADPLNANPRIRYVKDHNHSPPDSNETAGVHITSAPKRTFEAKAANELSPAPGASPATSSLSGGSALSSPHTRQRTDSWPPPDVAAFPEVSLPSSQPPNP